MAFPETGKAYMFISGLDIILIIVALISGLLAMVRGLTREVLSIASWGAAAIATVFSYSRFKQFAREQIDPDQLADVILIGGTFILVLIVVSYITSRISDFILDSRIGAIDRTLGFAFGVGRGLLLVVVGYLFFAWLVPEKDRPTWVQTARSLELIETTGDMLMNMLPEDPESAILDRVRKELEGDDTAGDPPEEGSESGINGIIEGQPSSGN
ncbi:MAG: CvpA family protein [Rhodobiaceae bacterium]|nr:CvpA family protein [Rhodobiaceae bacterium]MCC0013443.1 CvpA family protein [Rhodobiaceae bacterium]MCC0018254.1 CvpA family protein [Rhodobiaceae bacterium]MCC0050851.1 CvpA family protein [Rhodobiaceae bacterium]MCC0060504.1 CvpA family protein [Rhodobiaceae bacterium]